MILQVNCADATGGAGRAGWRLFQALRESGEDVRLRVQYRSVSDPAVIGPRSGASRKLQVLRTLAASRIARLQRPGDPGARALNLMPSGLAREIDRSGASVANLHFVNDEMLSIEEIGRLRTPVVMTLHDAWAFCGAEHYPAIGSRRHVDGYRSDNRPTGARGPDLDRWTWSRKRRSWRRPMVVVTPSRWLGDCARESALMRDWPVHVVPNPLDTSVYKPVDACVARDVLGLPQNVPLVVFGAIGGAADPRKGFDLLTDAMRRLAAGGRLPPGARCVVFGQRSPASPPDIGFPIHWMGHLSDDWSMVLLYNAASVVVVPSRQENLAQSATEAQACGTPTVGFRTTGMPDAIVHGETGWLAEPFDAEDLARGIEWVLAERERRGALGAAARARAVRSWSPAVVVPRYLEVFREAAERGGSASRP